MLTLENFKQQIDPTILKRGLQYFESQAVETLEENEPVHWEAVVSGSEN